MPNRMKRHSAGIRDIQAFKRSSSRKAADAVAGFAGEAAQSLVFSPENECDGTITGFVLKGALTRSLQSQYVKARKAYLPECAGKIGDMNNGYMLEPSRCSLGKRA